MTDYFRLCTPGVISPSIGADLRSLLLPPAGAAHIDGCFTHRLSRRARPRARFASAVISLPADFRREVHGMGDLRDSLARSAAYCIGVAGSRLQSGHSRLNCLTTSLRGLMGRASSTLAFADATLEPTRQPSFARRISSRTSRRTGSATALCAPTMPAAWRWSKSTCWWPRLSA